MIRFFKELTLNEFKKNRYAYLLIISALLFGFVSGIMLFLFILMGSFNIFDFGLNNGHALLFDSALSILFFLQHSILVRRSMKKTFARYIPGEYYAAFYGFSSGLGLFLVMLFWQKIPVLITTAEGVSLIILRIIFFLCVAGFYWGVKSLGSFDVLGVNGLIRYLHKKEEIKLPFTVKGPYRWVRHPLYLFIIIMIWSSPEITADRLLFNILWTIWIVVGTVLEERDLARDFKKKYRKYQSEVPMLVPYKIPAGIVIKKKRRVVPEKKAVVNKDKRRL